nr:hypothetical protein [Mycoplasmopsis bovis]QQH19140.1 hypothetical protein HYE48_03770 [Mycoplasmopsis bovis]
MKQNHTKPKLSKTLKSITDNDLEKYKLAEQINSSTKKKLKQLSKKLLLQKFETLKDKELNLNA